MPVSLCPGTEHQSSQVHVCRVTMSSPSGRPLQHGGGLHVHAGSVHGVGCGGLRSLDTL